MIDPEKVMEFIKTKGPVLPTQLSKIIGQDPLIASAYLSELTSSKKIKISHTKIGSSPVYYIEGQEPKLQDLYEHLEEREKEAYDFLKKRKILRDIKQTPAVRVALRNIKDFAIPLTVSHGDKKEIFWKWYLISNQEATGHIQKLLETLPKEPERQAKKPEQIAPKPVQEIKKEIQEEIIRPTEPKKNPFEEEKKKIEEEKRKLEQEKNRLLEQEKRLKQLNLERERLLKEKEKRLEEERQILFREQQKKQREQQKILIQKKKEQEDPFFNQIMIYLESKKIEILDYNIIKKKKEIDLRVRVPSVIGKLDYLCKAKKKRKISDTDINAIFVEGQIKKIPVLFLTTGILSKKAVEKLTNEFKGVMVDKLE